VNIFELEKVSFAYPQQTVFEQLDFKVPAGGFVALVGPNGAGKSTLLKLCLGLLKPSSGQVRIMEQAAAKFRNWTKIGYVPQNPLRDRSFPVTVEEIVAMGRVGGLGIGRPMGKADKEAIGQAMHTVGVIDFRHRLIGELSGGQQQRVMIARALASRPEALVLDEPASGVDTAAKEAMHRLLKELNQTQGVTILMVSHDVDKITDYAVEIACINNGINYYGAAGLFRDIRHPDAARADALKLGDAVNA